MALPNSYELSRDFWDWCYENPERITPNHPALYFFIIEHCNRLGWKEKFGLPTTMAKDAIGIRSYNTYSKTLADLIEWGFIKLIEKSKNQYSSNIVALSKFNKATTKALDKALIKHGTKQGESTGQSIDSIDKQYNNKQYNQFLSLFLELLGKTFRSQKELPNFKARVKEGFTMEQFKFAIENIKKDSYHKETNYKHITPEFLCRIDKLEKFINFKPAELPKKQLTDMSSIFTDTGVKYD